MATPGVGNWRQQILQGVGAPVTPANLKFFDLWQRAEGGTYSNNPFNTTLQSGQQVGPANSAGVRGYATPQAGIQATIDTLKNGYYGDILGALRQGTSASAAAQALASSPWGTGSGVLRLLGEKYVPSADSGSRSLSSAASSVPTAGAPTLRMPTGGLSALHLAAEPDYSSAVLSSLGKGDQAFTNAILGSAIRQAGREAAFPTIPMPSVPTLGPPKPGAPVTGAPAAGTSGGNLFSGPAGDYSGTPVSGSVIGTPFSGTHGKEFNVRGGSDNWESENAVDVSTPVGTPIYAVTNGVIGPQFGSLGSGGRFAGLRLHLNGGGNQYYYAHLSKFAPGIQPGSRVKAGDLLGYSGEANGVAHLHFASEHGNPQSFYSRS